MIRYRKGGAPARLTALAATPGTGWRGLGAPDKDELRAALVRDQGGLCAYCQRRISAEVKADGRPRMNIEHWAARSVYPALALTWTNLLGVCDGAAPSPPDLAGPLKPHCDVGRGAQPLFLHPVEGQGPDPRQYLEYASDGRVRAARPLPADRDDVETLNLNDPRLQRGRAGTYALIVERLRGLPESSVLGYLRKLAKRHEIRPGEEAPEHAEFVRCLVVKKLRQKGVAQ